MIGGVKNNKLTWETFEHNGVMFPEPYKPHGIPIVYDGVEIKLDPISEEYATIYAKYLDSDYVKKKLFNKNFFTDWKKILHSKGFKEIKNFDLISFVEIKKYIDMLKEEKKKHNISAEKKNDDHYKYAYVDGVETEIGNFRMEPAGLFLGRGNHPMAGKIKKTIYPEDIVINIDSNAKTPEMPPFYAGHKWGKIIHDKSSAWIARWKDTIDGKQKYVWLSNKSKFKAETDRYKFDLAKKLGLYIDKIRSVNNQNLTDPSVSMKTKQLATALYFIDYLALRVGNEKGEDKADTVGVSSLRLEHIDLSKENTILFDFLGKDSIRYKNSVHIDSIIYSNLLSFVDNKTKNDYLFDLIEPKDINEYLKNFLNGLSSKVFRTYNASLLFQQELDRISDEYKNYKKPDYNKVMHNEYVKANIKIAVLCNHQKSASKNYNEQIKKINDTIEAFETKKNECTNKEKLKKIKLKIKELKTKRDTKKNMKTLSISTSQMNYIDPRITIQFVKKHKLDINDYLSKALISKFHWAFDSITDDWNFNEI